SAQSQSTGTEIGQPKSLAKDFRLPNHVKPALYKVELEPNFDDDTFNGSIRITVSVLTTTNTIVLDKYELTIMCMKAYYVDDSVRCKGKFELSIGSENFGPLAKTSMTLEGICRLVKFLKNSVLCSMP
ncbi:Peptidase M1 N-terminal domain, partial [Popillia japonica]